MMRKRHLGVAVGVLLAALAWPAAAVGQIPEDSPVRAALEKAEAAVQAIIEIPAEQRTFENTLGAVDDMLAELENDTNMTMFLAYVSPDEHVRQRGTLAEEHVSNWLIDLQKREDLYKAIKAYADTSPQLEGERRRLLEHTLRDYRRAGMELDPAQREQLKAIQKEINRLGIEFEKNIREDETRIFLTREELAGMPDDYIAGLTETSGIYVLGMDYPTYVPLQTYCTVESTRKKAWIAYKRRGGLGNVRLLEQILKLRAQAAAMLGYAHAADYETEVRMAKNARTVREFYEKLRPLVRKKAEQDMAEFVAAKREHTGDPDARLYPWDQEFYKNRLKMTKYAVDSQKVKEYFPVDAVIEGLFSITQSLYGLKYMEVTDRASEKGVELWHPDARLFEVFDKATGESIGMFALDLFPRPNKYNHAAQWGMRQHKAFMDGRVQKPFAVLVCNFPEPTSDKPALMPHDDVETFFHEFGHCLHTILSEGQLLAFSGTATARDFVEAPSQMFENWVWDAETLGTFARHYETGEPIPQPLVESMLAARNLGSGLEAEHQFYYGLVDFDYHTAPDGEVDTTQLQLDLFEEVELYDAVPETYFQAAFGHLVGYQAGYYGYMWSKVYAADMFQRFKELGMLNPEAGEYYRDKILSRGGSRDEMDLVRDYLGREPNMEAFLELLGLE